MTKLNPNDTAPDFCLPGIDSNCEEKTYCLKDLLKNSEKWIILYFYPKDNTPGCTTEAKDFTQYAKDFKKLWYLIVWISKDSIKSHCNFVNKHNLNLILLSDPDTKVHQQYGAWGEKKNYGKITMWTIRSTFVIDKNWKIIKTYYNVRAKGHVERLLKELQS